MDIVIITRIYYTIESSTVSEIAGPFHAYRQSINEEPEGVEKGAFSGAIFSDHGR
jgi:hypothetical protein